MVVVRFQNASKMLEGKRYASKPFEYKYPKNGNTLKKFTGIKLLVNYIIANCLLLLMVILLL